MFEQSIESPGFQRELADAMQEKRTPSPGDWRNQLIYLIMVDRFNNPDKAPVATWDQAYGEFQGGVFKGIQDQLDYIKGMGAGALWLTPVLQNCQYNPGTYHGYGIQDFLAIDPRFASNPAQVEQELKDMINAAHAKGLYIIFDIVLHHTGDIFAYANLPDVAPWNTQLQPYTIQWRDQNGAAQAGWETPPPSAGFSTSAVVWPQELQQNALFERRGTTDFSAQTLKGDFFSLRSFYQDDNGNLPALQILIEVYKDLIAKYDVDGFRIDTLMYISPHIARVFANAIREYALLIGKDNFFVFGEVWADEATIAQFVGRDTRDPDTNEPIGVDAVLDYPLFGVLPGVCKGLSAPADVVNMFQKRKGVEQYNLSTHGDASNFFVTFLDNYDQNARFYYPGDKQQFAPQLTLALACLLTLPGVPCIYYGTEQGLWGSGTASEAVRQALWGKPDAFDNTHPFYQAIKTLADLRQAKLALCYGRYYFRPVAGDNVQFGISQTAPGVLAYSRLLSNEEVIVVANTSTVSGWTGTVIVDASLNQVGDNLAIVYSNLATKGNVQVGASGNGTVVHEADGSTSTGIVRTIAVHLQAMEVQIISRITGKE